MKVTTHEKITTHDEAARFLKGRGLVVIHADLRYVLLKKNAAGVAVGDPQVVCLVGRAGLMVAGELPDKTN